MAKKRTNTQPLKEVIEDFLRIYKLEDKMTEADVVAVWEELMGPAITKLTKSIYLRNKTLYIKLESGVLKEEFSYAKEKIITLINEKMGKEAVDNVKIY